MTNRQPLYPYTEWEVVEKAFDVGTNPQDETIFATGNGYIGFRGTFEEGWQGPGGKSVNGTYLNGFYESGPIVYPEEAYGYARNNQTMLNVTDSKIIRLEVDGEPFHLFHGKILDYSRELSLKNGVLTREVTWVSPAGKQVRICIRRLVSLREKHLAAISYEVTPINFEGSLRFISALDGKVQNQVAKGDPRTGSALSGQVLVTRECASEGTRVWIRQHTKNSGLGLFCAADHEITAPAGFNLGNRAEDQLAVVIVDTAGRPNETVRLTKYIAYVDTRDVPEDGLAEVAARVLGQAKEKGFETILDVQRAYLDHFWRMSDVVVEGDAALQQGLRFNAFHLLQSVGKDGRTNIGAKGLTGEGYEGHYFWDTEMFILPFFLYTHPEISRKLLEYRCSTLDKARERAAEMAQKGALYAWRTINGEETSAYYPAGTAQYHINADIIYGLRKYVTATLDTPFFLECGAEMLFETARLWADLGHYNPRKGDRFVINNVTGPDEYTAVVNNNAFTNLMARHHLEYAAASADRLKTESPEEYRRIAEKMRLDDTEIEVWRQAADRMYIPDEEQLGIIAQDDSFLDKEVWDFANTPADRYPLLLHYHPLVIYRHQVLKQADLVLALFLLGDRFTIGQKKRNYDFYEPLTTHDSSLSPSIYSIIAAEVGYTDKAYGYFSRTARMDLDDINDNVKDGVHTAAMAGAWLAVVHGFGGFREYGGELHFRPVIPPQWTGYRFRIVFRGRVIEVDVTAAQSVYRLLEGDSLDIYHGDERSTLQREQPLTLAPLG